MQEAQKLTKELRQHSNNTKKSVTFLPERKKVLLEIIKTLIHAQRKTV
jgi:hypothetical protein